MSKVQKQAAIYVRKSSKDSREGENRSLAAQKKECKELAKRHGLEVVHIYEEEVGVSASHLKNHERPVLDEFLNGFGSQHGVGISWAFDRVTRKGMGEAGMILDRVIESGGRLLTCSDGIDTDDERQRLMLAIRSEISRDEIATMGNRVRRGKEGQRSRGELIGGKAPYGTAKDPSAPYGIILVPEEVDAIKAIVGKILDGNTVADACRWANAEGFTTTSGACFNPQIAARFLRSPHLLGHRYYPKQNETFCDEDGKPVQVTDPIISEVDYYRLQQIVKPKTGRNRKWQKGDPSPLFGFTKCSSCGKRLYFPWRYKTGEGKYQTNADDRYVKCVETSCAARASSYYTEFHDHVVNAALSFAATLDPDSPVMEEVARRWMGTTTPEVEGKRNSLKDRIDVLKGQQAELAKDYYERNLIERDTFDHLVGDLENKMDEVRIELSQLPEKDLDITPILDLTQCAEGESLTGEGSAWAQLDVHAQHAVLMCLVEEVQLIKGDTAFPVRAPVADRIQITFTTENNVYELKDRKFDMKKVAVAAS